jgi:hypothetical protein
MRLKKILLEALAEQDAQGLDDTIEFPNQNFVVSVDRNQKKLIFSPQSHSALPSKMRTFINMLKRDFRITRLKSLEDEGDQGPGDTDDPNLRGVFEVQLDPREDVNEVVDYIKKKVEEENL